MMLPKPNEMLYKTIVTHMAKMRRLRQQVGVGVERYEASGLIDFLNRKQEPRQFKRLERLIEDIRCLRAASPAVPFSRLREETDEPFPWDIVRRINRQSRRYRVWRRLTARRYPI